MASSLAQKLSSTYSRSALEQIYKYAGQAADICTNYGSPEDAKKFRDLEQSISRVLSIMPR